MEQFNWDDLEELDVATVKDNRPICAERFGW